MPVWFSVRTWTTSQHTSDDKKNIPNSALSGTLTIENNYHAHLELPDKGCGSLSVIC